MATKNLTTKMAHVSLYKAFKAPDYGTGFSGIIYHNLLTEPPFAQKEIVFTTLDNLAQQVNEFGFTLSHEHGIGLAAMVSMKRGERKPPGFDAMKQQRDFTYNLIEEPKDEPPKPTPEQQAKYDEARRKSEARSKERTSLSAAETAKLLRNELRRHFPDTKFSVTSDTYSGGASIDVKYTDGPALKAVEKIAHQFQGGGFDGMIDMAFNYDHWLLPDGSTRVAYTPGTEGSKGTYERIETERPHPEAKLVSFGADFVSVNRHYTDEAINTKIREMARKYGCDPALAVTQRDDCRTELTQHLPRNNTPHEQANLELAEKSL